MESTTGYTFNPCVGCFPWHRHQIGYIIVSHRKDHRYPIPNVESQVFTPNITYLVRSGIKPKSPACQAGMLTTTPLRLSVFGGIYYVTICCESVLFQKNMFELQKGDGESNQEANALRLRLLRHDK